METIRSTGVPVQPYYSHGLRKKFIIDGLKSPATSVPFEGAAEIGYEVDEEKYLARVLKRGNDESRETEVPPDWPQSLDGPLVWEPSDIAESDFVYHLTAMDKLEIDKALEYFKEQEIDGELVSCETFPLPQLSAELDKVCTRVYEGIGFAVVRGLDPEQYTPEDFAVVYLGISSYVAERRGRQDQRGSMLMHVIRHNDDGRDRQYCLDKPFHTDTVTDCLCLVTRNCSKEGGSSILASSWTVYNELAATRPDILHVMAKPDWPFDTYGRAPPYYNRALMYYYDSKLITCFSRRLLVGHEPYEPRSRGIPGLNEAQAEALDAVHFIAKKHELKTVQMKGDIRFVNNMAVMHRREAFVDEGPHNRHLVRLWLNNEMMCWKLPRPLRLAWARVFEDDERTSYWDIEPIREKNGTISRTSGSCD